MPRYLALDVGGSAIKYAVADDSYTLSRPGTVPTCYDSHAAFVETIGSIYDRFAGEVSGIAMSCCGELDPVSGHMFSGGALTFNAGTNMLESVSARCGVGVSLENDANCALLAEAHSGSLLGCRNAVVLVVGTGIGGAIMIDGHLYHGSHFHSGNASFTKVDLADPGRSQLAEVNGVPALLDDHAARAGLAAPVDGRDFFDRLEAGDSAAVAALDAFCGRLAAFVFNVQLLLDVEVCAIGGGISARQEFVDTLRRAVDALYERAPVQLPPPLVRSCRYRNDANLIGALHHHLNPGG